VPLFGKTTKIIVFMSSSHGRFRFRKKPFSHLLERIKYIFSKKKKNHKLKQEKETQEDGYYNQNWITSRP
jgi:transposase